MKRLLGFLLLSVIMAGCFAQGKVKGELRTEKNGFQWYYYKGKNVIGAYSIDGKEIIFTDKTILDIRFIAVDKEDEGMFVVISYNKDREYKGWYTVGAYSQRGKHIASSTDTGIGKERYGLPKIERCGEVFSRPRNKEYYIRIIFGSNSIAHELYDANGNKLFHFEDLKRMGDYFDATYKFKHYIYKYNGKNIIGDVDYIYNKGDYFIVEKKGEKGLMANSGVWIVPLETGYEDYNLFKVHNEELYRVKYKNSSRYHLISGEGNDILGKAYDDITISDNYIKVKEKGSYGIITFDRKEIISTSRGYTSIGNYDSSKGTFAFTKKGYEGVCDAQGKEISLTKLPPTAEDIKSAGGYVSAVELMNGSTKYYKVSKNNRYGLTNSDGKVIIPAEMESLEQAGTGFLRFKLNGFYGIVNYAGKIIIPTDRGYTKIGDYVSFTKRFVYEMDGYKGECNNLGVQVSKIKVNKPVAQQSIGSSSSSKTSNDPATFDLKGNVKKCVMGSDTREFDRNGKLIVSGNQEIIYDNKGRISEIKVGIDGLGGGYKYEYDNNGRVKIEVSLLSLLGNTAEVRNQFFYNNKGQIVKKILTTNGGAEQTIIYSDYTYDSHGNWISREKDGSIETRTIEYY